MNTYFRILRYAPSLGLRLFQFFLFSVLGVVFQAIYLGLTKPMLDVFAQAAIYDPNSQSIHDFMKYVKPSSGAVPQAIADFAYQIGYVHFAQQKRDTEHAQQYLQYGKGTEGVDPRIEKALKNLR